MNEYDENERGERGAIEPRMRRQGVSNMLDWEPFRSVFPGNWQQMFGIDVNRRDGMYEIEMPVPGFKPEEIEISYQDGIITVSGKNDRRTFTRSLTVPEDIDEDSISANVEHGVLTLSLKQHPKRQPRRIAIGGSRTTTGTAGSQQGTTASAQTTQTTQTSNR